MKKISQSKIIKAGALLAAVIVLPNVAFAVRNLKDVIDLIIRYIGYVIPLLISLCILTFIWGIYKYFFKVDANKEEAGNLVLWGVIGFFVMVSFWGLVNILVRTFELDTTPQNLPFIPGQQLAPPSSGAGINNGEGGAGINNGDPRGLEGADYDTPLR